jgi:hypothetical protein
MGVPSCPLAGVLGEKPKPGRGFPPDMLQILSHRRDAYVVELACSRGCAPSPWPRGTDGATRFTVREEYKGPLLPMIWRSMPDLGPFRQFANGLKQRAER